MPAPEFLVPSFNKILTEKSPYSMRIFSEIKSWKHGECEQRADWSKAWVWLGAFSYVTISQDPGGASPKVFEANPGGNKAGSCFSNVHSLNSGGVCFTTARGSSLSSPLSSAEALECIPIKIAGMRAVMNKKVLNLKYVKNREAEDRWGNRVQSEAGERKHCIKDSITLNLSKYSCLDDTKKRTAPARWTRGVWSSWPTARWCVQIANTLGKTSRFWLRKRITFDSLSPQTAGYRIYDRLRLSSNWSGESRNP